MKMLKSSFDRGELGADYRNAYRTQYPIAVPDPAVKADAAVCAHIEGWQQVSAMAGRLMDGSALLEHLSVAGKQAFDGIGAAVADEAKLTTMASDLDKWLNELVGQPDGTGSDAWLPRKLEYQFGWGSSRETQLQRAAMPRLLGAKPFESIRPRTTLLREGLPGNAYFIDEEEVPRAGALVRQAFQRTRWLGGKVFVWFGAAKSTGRGEGSSGLAFDLLEQSGEK